LACWASMNPRTSSLVMRPPRPVPRTCAALIPFSARRRRTIGDSNRAPSSGAPSGIPGALAANAGGAGGGGGGTTSARAGSTTGWLGGGAAGAGAGAGAGAAAWGSWAGTSAGAPDAAACPSPMTANRVPTSTVSPSGTTISVRTPAAGDGTSVSTLSVDTSKRGSSRSTCSPIDFIQRVIVPSVTVSPSCGMVTSAKVQSPSGQSQHRLAEALGQ
jgi:hypothetical protein